MLKEGRDSSRRRANKDTQKFGLWLWFQVLGLGYATDFHKTWANPQSSHTELLLKIQLLTLPDARKNYCTAQSFPPINSPTPERNSEGRGLMHLLDSLADIFALLVLSPLKSYSHISEEYCNIIFIYCIFKLLLWEDFSNKNTAFLLVLLLCWTKIYFCCLKRGIWISQILLHFHYATKLQNITGIFTIAEYR